MFAGGEKIGDWDGVKAFLAGNLGAKLAAALRQANIKNALFLVREIKRGIRSQAPGGVLGGVRYPAGYG